ncbi:hypothetical protein KY343_03715 [Candidatus Woesearchaeota archaeon]|nr:hypothetical protein [Candidatus Woesearchaeota archaeon]
MISKKDIKTWYLLNINKIQLPLDSSKRQYKFLCYNGEWRKIRKQIRRPEQLLPYIEKYKPLSIYYTLGKWQNPVKLGSKRETKGYRVSDHNLLSLDFGIDVDDPNLEVARRNALKILNIMKKDYPLLYIAFSGSKGFHLVFKDTQNLSNAQIQREEKLSDFRKIYISQNLRDIKFDVGRSLNTRQVFKVPGTLAAKTGSVVQILTEEQLKQPINKLIKDIDFIDDIHRSGMFSRIQREAKQMTRVTDSSVTPSAKNLGAKGADLTIAPKFYFESFITNQVIGCKDRYVLFLHYPLGTKKYKRDIKKLDKIYRLGEVFVFKDEEEITAVCCRTFAHRRLVKILNASKSTKKFEQSKFGKQFFAVNSKTILLDVVVKHSFKSLCKSKGHSAVINCFIKYSPEKTEGKNKVKKVKVKFKKNG